MRVATESEYRYKVGGSLKYHDPTYVTRQADTELLATLKAGKFGYVFNCRQMGKSSLRVQAMHQLQGEGMSCASIDITSIGSEITPQQWYGGVINQLFLGFNLIGKVNLKAWLRERQELPPVQKLGRFIEDVLLVHCPGDKIFIFIDEIDKVLSLNFSLDDFFSLIRFCYNQRAENPAYERLTFALFGVATPSDLIREKTQTPFNIGQAIELTGFKETEAQPLLVGLQANSEDPQAVLREIIVWTGGQPFLTQKFCNLVAGTNSFIKIGTEIESIEELGRSHIIDNWESQDEPVHLKTIRDRLLNKEQRAGGLLGLYQQILERGEIAADNSPEQGELRLSGLVVKQRGEDNNSPPVLRVYNRIYREVFNRNWVEKELEKLRPYGEAIAAWEASQRQDESWLLRGKALQDAQVWTANKSLSSQDYQFLAASQELDKRMALEARELELLGTQLEAEKKAKQQLAQDYQKAKQRLGIGSAILFVSLVGAVIATVSLNFAFQKQKETQVETLEWVGKSALKQFDFQEIEALLTAMEAGEELTKLVRGGYQLPNYSFPMPLIALQEILDNIREKNELVGHEETVNGVTFSPDGKYLATASRDGTAKLWDLQGQELITFKGHQGDVYNVSFSPDGQKLATASRDGTAKLWDLQGQELATFKGHQQDVYNLSFSPDGQKLATASRDGTAKLWDLKGQELVTFKWHQGTVYNITFSPDGKLLATASQDATVKLWNLQGKNVKTIKGHQGAVYEVTFSPDGKYLATASQDGTAILWNREGEVLTIFKGHEGAVYGVTFSPDGKYLATASDDTTVKLWDLQGQELTTLKGYPGSVYRVSFSPDGEKLATASSEKIIRLWDFQENPIEPQQEILNSTLSPDGKQLIVAFNNGTLRVENLQEKSLAEFMLPRETYSIGLSPDGKKLATGSQNGWVYLWDLQGKEIAAFEAHQDLIYSVKFSPDGQKVATASRDGTAKIWDLQGNLLAKFIGHQQPIYNLSFSPDGKMLATASDDETVKLWNLQGKELATLKGHRGTVYDVNFSPDSKQLASAGHDGSVRLWDVQGKLLKVLEGSPVLIYRVSFSPDGKLIAAGARNGVVRLWDRQGKLLAAIERHQDLVNSISFSADGNLLATASRDGTLRVWTLNASALARLEQLLGKGCAWLQDYLITHPERKKLEMCYPSK